MAIIQSSLQEDVLSRAEKSVIRGIFRASQLSEAKIALDKTIVTLGTQNAVNTVSQATTQSHFALIKDYLDSAIVAALVSTKVPATSSAKGIDISHKEK